ncbi:hypothetical protein RND71_010701 [Anisodus tanguticus]|uniref:C2H2-type domain-containing protein n=1 Tax=Anisodus tanguticus TaxID=243964 RepID=A0AAE1SM54_9SOLA|nr:hypothetical protein RND71_010701 [Anisodus tanguticus]
MATNRFLCEVCNKGFQREQNLQLHRRGHNLPWKLKQKNPKEVAKRKVYLCPEPTCVHHEPSRALGDLTGIKKHYFRKHGEKKYKCEKCSKKYAVQSDWKSHSKTCGTREYRCDCGTLFSRRDSFITHRAFCDALAQESTRNIPTTLGTLGSHEYLYGSNNINLGFSKIGSTNISDQNQLHLGSNNNTKTSTFGGQYDHSLIGSSTTSSFFLQYQSNQDYDNNKPMINGLMQLPNLDQNNNNTPMFGLNFFQNNSSNNIGVGNSNNLSPNSGILGDHNNISCSIPCLYGSQFERSTTTSPIMSATALLQKAAQMGSSTTSNSASLLKALGSTNNSSSSGTKSDHQPFNFGDVFSDHRGNPLPDKIFGLPGEYSGVNSYGGGQEQDQNDYGGGYNTETKKLNFDQGPPQKKQFRDFLGVGEIVRSISGGFSSEKQQHQQLQNQQGFGSVGNFQ